jgi:hypothetical protein
MWKRLWISWGAKGQRRPEIYGVFCYVLGGMTVWLAFRGAKVHKVLRRFNLGPLKKASHGQPQRLGQHPRQG